MRRKSLELFARFTKRENVDIKKKKNSCMIIDKMKKKKL